MVSRQEFEAADPVPVDARPTPFAQAVVPASEPPLASTPSEVDARVDRLLSELLIALREKKALNENINAVMKRSSELLEFGRKAKRIVREFLDELESEACPGGLGHIDDESPLHVDGAIDGKLVANLRKLAAEVL